MQHSGRAEGPLYHQLGVIPPMVKYCTLSAKEGLKASKCCQRKLHTTRIAAAAGFVIG
jgi:hypothetical protein